jgi:hypothetical protein
LSEGKLFVRRERASQPSELKCDKCDRELVERKWASHARTTEPESGIGDVCPDMCRMKKSERSTRQVEVEVELKSMRFCWQMAGTVPFSLNQPCASRSPVAPSPDKLQLLRWNAVDWCAANRGGACARLVPSTQNPDGKELLSPIFNFSSASSDQELRSLERQDGGNWLVDLLHRLRESPVRF